MTTTANTQRTDWAARRAAREANLLAAFDPTVPGIPGDGSPVVLHVDTEHPAGVLTYTWYDISRRTQDFQSRERGFLVSRLTVTCRTDDGEDIEVAGLNVTHTTRELIADEFPTPFHWADENTSAHFGFDHAAEDGREVTPQQIWAAAYTHLPLSPPSVSAGRGWGGLSACQAPTDPAVLADELAVAEKEYATMMRGFTRWLLTPFVDYAHVDNEFDANRRTNHPGSLRRTGIGRHMYLLAAQRLASQGKTLRGSGIQTPEAEALWASLAADPTVPTRKTQVTYYRRIEERTKKYLCLDYTRTSPAAQSATEGTTDA